PTAMAGSLRVYVGSATARAEPGIAPATPSTAASAASTPKRLGNARQENMSTPGDGGSAPPSTRILFGELRPHDGSDREAGRPHRRDRGAAQHSRYAAQHSRYAEVAEASANDSGSRCPARSERVDLRAGEPVLAQYLAGVPA